jgi:hypothetical protein
MGHVNKVSNFEVSATTWLSIRQYSKKESQMSALGLLQEHVEERMDFQNGVDYPHSSFPAEL